MNVSTDAILSKYRQGLYPISLYLCLFAFQFVQQIFLLSISYGLGILMGRGRTR